jgi:RimJ/RimL family protein N-acetyltransferase
MIFSDIPISLQVGITIRSILPDDVHAGYIEALNSPDRMHYTSVFKRPYETFESVKTYIESILQAPDQILWGIFIDKVLIGTSRVHDINFNTGIAFMGVLIFDSTQDGKGYGSLLVKTVSDFILSTQNITIIKAGIKHDHIASQKCFAKAGFTYMEDDESFPNFIRQIWGKTRR